MSKLTKRTLISCFLTGLAAVIFSPEVQASLNQSIEAPQPLGQIAQIKQYYRCDVVGRWQWFTGGDVTIYADGTFTQANSLTGTWYCSNDGRIIMSWSHGYTDKLRLTPDGNKLEGFGSRDPNATAGHLVWGLRQDPRIGTVCNIAGIWQWFTGGDVTIYADGTFTQANSLTGTWYCSNDGRIIMSWSHGYTDKLSLTSDGNKLEGFGNRDPNATAGHLVWGIRR